MSKEGQHRRMRERELGYLTSHENFVRDDEQEREIWQDSALSDACEMDNLLHRLRSPSPSDEDSFLTSCDYEPKTVDRLKRCRTRRFAELVRTLGWTRVERTNRRRGTERGVGEGF